MNAGAFFASFFASAVEAIEMVTIVIGVGATRGWRSSLIGAGTGFGVLVVIGGALGTALTALPINALRIGVGGLLLAFGLQWLAKGIRRVAERGLSGDPDEDVDSDVPVAAEGIDWTAFVLSFKGVLLEGLEIAFIVVSFGATAGKLTAAAAGGGSALVLIAALGVAFHRLVNRIPRSVLILVVGVMLASFGSFWSVEGLGIHWPGGDAAIPALVALYATFGLTLVTWMRRGLQQPARSQA